MANYEAIMRHYPEVREFVRNRRWVHRGDVLFYGANTKGQHFSTDSAGFRHSIFKGKTFSASDVRDCPRYGVVMGPSNVYGFGLSGNENTMPSLLAERFEFPFLNVGLPEGNSRNLFSILLAIANRTRHKPAVVLHLSGGDFTSFCYTSIADAIFGPPNLKQMPLVLKEHGGERPDPATQMQPLLGFTTLWLRSIGQYCQAMKVPLVFGEDVTFFEKAEPSAVEAECELGKAMSKPQTAQFEVHKKYVREYHDRRQAVAKALGVPLAGPSFGNDIQFVDEFHYNKQGTRDLTNYFAREIESVLR